MPGSVQLFNYLFTSFNLQRQSLVSGKTNCPDTGTQPAVTCKSDKFHALHHYSLDICQSPAVFVRKYLNEGKRKSEDMIQKLNSNETFIVTVKQVLIFVI